MNSHPHLKHHINLFIFFCVCVLPNESDNDCTIFVAFKCDTNGMIYILSFTLKVMKLFHFELHSKSFKSFTF